MPSATLDLNRLSAQVHDLAVLSDTNDVNRIDVGGLINLDDHLVEALAHIRSLQNRFSPINQLPPEVLVNIIAFIQDDLPTHSPFPLPQNINYWAQVLGVCRHWRTNLISAPSLWRQIHLYRLQRSNSIQRTKVWLDRSQDIPFKFYFTGVLPGRLKGDTEATEFPVDVFSHVSRLQELHISSLWARSSRLWELIDQPAPMLESFSFVMGRESGIEDSLTVLPRIFQDNMPKLRNLTLVNVSSWPHNRFANLTRFSLTDQPPHNRPTFLEFLAFLAASPKLQELVLVDAGPISYGHVETHRLSPVVLPCLQYIEIGMNQWRTKGELLRLLLKHLDIPTTATRCFYEGTLHLSIAEHFMQKEYGTQILESLNRIVITSHKTILGYEQFVGLKDSTLYCNYSWGTPSLGLPSQTLLLRNVEELVYAPAHCWDPGNLTTLLGQLPSLRRLKVSGALWDRFDEAVRPLQELSVCREGFKNASQLDELHIYPLDIEGDLQPEEGTDPVVILGNVRANNGYPLKRIVVQRFHDESIQRLQGYFDEVVVLDEEAKTGVSKDDVLGSCWRSYGCSV